VKSSAGEVRVGLLGNPNCGKTTIFNALTGARQKTANWSGVTIEKREGTARFEDHKIKIVDLPGIYSLSAYSLEEIIARNYIIHDQPDVIVNVVDAGNLERNLYLTTQLINIGVKVILVLNMYDEAEAKGISVDTGAMGTLLGMPVLATVGVKNRGIRELLSTIVSVARSREEKVRHIHIDYGIDIEKERGPWYKSIGQGMGAALNTAGSSNAYVLADRGTWISFKNKGDLVIAVEGDKRLFNQYGVTLVNPAKYPNVKKQFGQAFIDWIVSPEGQKAIADYKINGEQLFYPNASDAGA